MAIRAGKQREKAKLGYVIECRRINGAANLMRRGALTQRHCGRHSGRRDGRVCGRINNRRWRGWAYLTAKNLMEYSLTAENKDGGGEMPLLCGMRPWPWSGNGANRCVWFLVSGNDGFLHNDEGGNVIVFEGGALNVIRLFYGCAHSALRMGLAEKYHCKLHIFFKDVKHNSTIDRWFILQE